MNYHVLYDVANENMPYNWAFPLFIVVIGIIVLFFNRKKQEMTSKEKSKRKTAQILFFIFIAFGFLAFTMIIISEISNKWKTEEILNNNEYETIIGMVRDYERYAPREVQVRENFKIEGVEFNFQEWDETYLGYRPNHKSQLVKPDQFLKIKYYNAGKKKIILKIEEKRFFNSKGSFRAIYESEFKYQSHIFLLSIYEVEKGQECTKLLIHLHQNNILKFSDTLKIEMTEPPFIYLKDVNGDKKDDLLIEFLRPGRGGNNVSMLYVFNKKRSSFEKIKNSDYFPNLSYDYHLNMISSFRFYGGNAVQMDFLQLHSDSLSSKYRVTREEQTVYLEKWNGKKFGLIEKKNISKEIIVPEVEQLEPAILIKEY